MATDERIPIKGFTIIKVFTTTDFKERPQLGDRLTEWAAREGVALVAVEVLQSSDIQRHCLTLVAFARPLE